MSTLEKAVVFVPCMVCMALPAMRTQLPVLQVAVALLVQLPLLVIITWAVGCKINKPPFTTTPCEKRIMGKNKNNMEANCFILKELLSLFILNFFI
jgi:hypothetical protein